MKKQKKNRKSNICLVLFGVCFLAFLGIAGGLEGGMIAFGQACLWTALDLSVMGALIVLGRLYESKEE